MIIKNETNDELLAMKAFNSRFMGLMWRRIDSDEACVLRNPLNDRFNAGIHMFFVPQELDVLWLDEGMRVVDRKHCIKWRLYWPVRKASYVVELLDAKNAKLGDSLSLK